MESANLHDHQQQQQQLMDSSPLVNPSFYEVGTTRAASWTPYPILNNNGPNFNPNIINGAPINSRDSNCLNASNNSMIQDLGFGSFTSLASVSDHDLQLSRIKEELSSSSSSSHHSSYPKFTEMLKGSPSSSSSIDLDSHLLLHPSNNSSSYIKNEQRDHLLKTFSSGCHVNGLQLPPAAGGGGGGGLFYSTPTSRRSFSQIYPTINISNLNQLPASSEVSSSSLVMNLEALDLFSSARFSTATTNISHSSQDHQLGLPKSSLDYNMQQQLSHRQANSPTNVSPFNNGVTEVKRSSSFLETKAPQALTTPKKSRLDSRSSCAPFKVRKEKLGDRIAALQQLVAPFGKTDTASVLMETIGYIKFLQNQVEALSVPYMKSSRNKARKMQGGSGEDGELEGATRDLRSRGLCLVPLTCLSYVTDGGGGSGV